MMIVKKRVARPMPERLPPKRFVGATMLMKQDGLLDEMNFIAEAQPHAKAKIHVFATGHGFIPAANRDGVFTPHGKAHSQSIRKFLVVDRIFPRVSRAGALITFGG